MRNIHLKSNFALFCFRVCFLWPHPVFTVITGLKETEERYYLLVKESRSFSEAAVSCQLRGGSLATPTTSSNNRLMAACINEAGLSAVFIGLQAPGRDLVRETVRHRLLINDSIPSSLWLTFASMSFFFHIRWHQAATWTPTPAACRASPLGAQRRTIWEYLQAATRAACSCSAVERGAGWSVRPPCFSSASSPRAGGEEEEEEEPCFHPSRLSRSRRTDDETRDDTTLHSSCSRWDFRSSSSETDEQFAISTICFNLTLQFMLHFFNAMWQVIVYVNNSVTVVWRHVDRFLFSPSITSSPSWKLWWIQRH